MKKFLIATIALLAVTGCANTGSGSAAQPTATSVNASSQPTRAASSGDDSGYQYIIGPGAVSYTHLTLPTIYSV